MVSDAQVRLLRQKMTEGKTQETAAAGMSVRTARTWQHGPLRSATKVPRHWRTRADPFAAVWATDVLALLEGDTKGALEATTLVEVLATKYSGRWSSTGTLTLARRNSSPLPNAASDTDHLPTHNSSPFLQFQRGHW